MSPWNQNWKSSKFTRKSSPNSPGSLSFCQTTRATFKNNSKKPTSPNKSTLLNWPNNTISKLNITKKSTKKSKKKISNSLPELSNSKVNSKWLKTNSKKQNEILPPLKKTSTTPKTNKKISNSLSSLKINNSLRYRQSFLPHLKLSNP